MMMYGPFEPDLVHTSGGKWRYLLLSLSMQGRFLLFKGSGLLIPLMILFKRSEPYVNS